MADQDANDGNDAFPTNNPDSAIDSTTAQLSEAISPSSTPSISPLLRIPRELRDKIYRNVLKDTTTTLGLWGGLHPNIVEDELVLDTTILCVNKQVYNEASSILLQENTFSVGVPRRGSSIAESYNDKKYKVLLRTSRLELEVHCSGGRKTLTEAIKWLTMHSGLKSLCLVMLGDPGMCLGPRNQLDKLDISDIAVALQELMEIKVDKRISVKAQFLGIRYYPSIPAQHQEFIVEQLSKIERELNERAK